MKLTTANMFKNYSHLENQFAQYVKLVFISEKIKLCINYFYYTLNLLIVYNIIKYIIN